jgi:hypothetical protein
LARNGLVGSDRQVLGAVAARLAALAVPDVEIVIIVSHGQIRWPAPIDVRDRQTWSPGAPDDQLNVVLARRDRRWVSAVRAGTDITVDDVECGQGFGWVADILIGLFDAFLPGEPSRLVAMNLPFDELGAAAAERARLGDANPAPLRRLGVPPAALAELGELLDAPAAEAVVYARAHTEARVHSSVCTLDVRATPSGRVVLYRMPTRPGTSQGWMAIAPASVTQVAHGLHAVLSSLNVSDWATHRRLR